MMRSVVAVVTGFVVVVVLAVGADGVLRAAAPQAFDAAGHANGRAILLLMLGYTAVSAVIGAYVTARVAPARPLFHALVLGGIALVLSTLATIGAWRTAPIWYHATALAMILPCSWLGGRARERQVTYPVAARAIT